jgi:hypothetical protein
MTTRLTRLLIARKTAASSASIMVAPCSGSPEGCFRALTLTLKPTFAIVCGAKVVALI